MGIPRLMTQVSPYGESVTWRKRDNLLNNAPPTKKENIVIDGPSFCYFIHHKCLSTKTHARHALEAVPTYQELSEAAIAWLEELETFGFCIKHIFFDGFLPPSKSSTRHDRLEKNLLQLRSFRSTQSTIVWSSTSNTSNTSAPSRPKPASTTTTPPHIPARLSALPAAPFLVPTILSALQHSRYAAASCTVPCEADVACIRALTPGSNDIILTNDSDLLVLASTGRIMFFGDLAFGTLHTSQDTLMGVSYSPPSLAAALGLSLSGGGIGEVGDDMLKLAFWMTRDSSLGIKECAKLAITSRAGFADEHVAGKYGVFKEAYTSATQFSGYALNSIKEGEGTGGVNQKQEKLQKCLERLDPRVSEVVQQWLSFPIREDRGAGAAPRQIQTFLPFLLDDPTRASAWRASAEIRQLAYSMLALHSSAFTLTECDRRGERMVGVDVPLLSAQDVMGESRTLLTSITNTLSDPQNPKRTTHSSTTTTATLATDATPTPSAWLLTILALVLRSTAASSTAPPSRQQILHFAIFPASTYAWPHVHLSAQCEGMVYSLRMLGQILDVLLCGDIPTADTDRAGQGDGKGEVTEMLSKLNQLLKTLPEVEDIFGRASAGFLLKPFSEESMRALVKVMDEVFGREEKIEEGGFAKQRGKKRKGGAGAGKAQVGGDAGSSGGGAGGQKVVNMFELLREDM